MTSRHLRSWLLLVILAGSAASAASPGQSLPGPEPPPESELPLTHWACELFSGIQARGVQCRPDPFAGRRTHTRLEMAMDLREALLVDIERTQGEGASWDPGWPVEVRRLAETFRRELLLLGVGRREVDAGVEQFAAVWADPRPRGVTIPLLHPTWPPDAQAREVGQAEARREWASKELVLWSLTPLRDGTAFPSAIPLRLLEGSDPAAGDRVNGHNAEVWRLLRTYGASPAARLAWTRDLFRLEQFWHDRGRDAHLLRMSDAGFTCFDGSVNVRLDATSQRVWPASGMGGLHPMPDLAVETPSGRFCLRLAPYRSVEVLSGEPGSGVIFLCCWALNDDPDAQWRDHPRGSAERAQGRRMTSTSGRRIYAVDVRTGTVLNAVAALARPQQAMAEISGTRRVFESAWLTTL
jgi:hypothetical protein